jgi:hypothetical protein
MPHGLRIALVAGLSLAATSLPAASDWQVFKSDRFGFAMLVAPGTHWEIRDFGHGWGGMVARKDQLKIMAIANMGDFSDASVIERAAVKITEVPGEFWSLEDQGQNANGWRWWRTYKVRLLDEGRVMYGMLGHGPRGSYLILLKTSESDFEAHKPLYLEWYNSLSVY